MILSEEQLEIVVTSADYGIIVLEAVYDNRSLDWDWCVNGIETGHKIQKHNSTYNIRNNKINAKIALKEMIDTIKYSTNEITGVESKQIRHQPFKNRYTIELVKRLASDIYPELLI